MNGPAAKYDAKRRVIKSFRLNEAHLWLISEECARLHPGKHCKIFESPRFHQLKRIWEVGIPRPEIKMSRIIRPGAYRQRQ